MQAPRRKAVCTHGRCNQSPQQSQQHKLLHCPLISNFHLDLCKKYMSLNPHSHWQCYGGRRWVAYGSDRKEERAGLQSTWQMLAAGFELFLTHRKNAHHFSASPFPFFSSHVNDKITKWVNFSLNTPQICKQYASALKLFAFMWNTAWDIKMFLKLYTI